MTSWEQGRDWRGVFQVPEGRADAAGGSIPSRGQRSARGQDGSDNLARQAARSGGDLAIAQKKRRQAGASAEVSGFGSGGEAEPELLNPLISSRAPPALGGRVGSGTPLCPRAERNSDAGRVDVGAQGRC